MPNYPIFNNWIVLFLILWFIVTVLLLFAEMLQKSNGKINVEFSIFNIKIKGGNLMVQMTATQEVTGTLAPVDAKGNAAQVQAGSVTVESSDEDIVRVERDADDELKFKLVAGGKVGTAQVNFKADADLGEGVVTLEGFTGVEIQAGQAVGFSANFGEPVEQQA